MTRKKTTPEPVGESDERLLFLTSETVNELAALSRGLQDAITNYAASSGPWDDIPIATDHLISALMRLSSPILLHQKRILIEATAEIPPLVELPPTDAMEPAP